MKSIILSRVSTDSQDIKQQTDKVLAEVKKDGFSDDDIIIIEDKESGVLLSEEERNGLNKLKQYVYHLAYLESKNLKQNFQIQKEDRNYE